MKITVTASNSVEFVFVHRTQCHHSHNVSVMFLHSCMHPMHPIGPKHWATLFPGPWVGHPNKPGQWASQTMHRSAMDWGSSIFTEQPSCLMDYQSIIVTAGSMDTWQQLNRDSKTTESHNVQTTVLQMNLNRSFIHSFIPETILPDFFQKPRPPISFACM